MSARTKSPKVVSAAAARRRQQITAIHVGRTQLRIDEDTYRALLRRVSVAHGDACDSSADMTPAQLGAVIEELRSKGADIDDEPRPRRRPGKHYPGKPRNFTQLPDEIAKIEAQLASMGLAWAYADAIAKRMFRIPFVAWCKQDQLRAIVAALDVEQIKRWQATELDRLTKALKLRPRDIEKLTSDLPRGWRRNRDLMDRVLDQLRRRLPAESEGEL